MRGRFRHVRVRGVSLPSLMLVLWTVAAFAGTIAPVLRRDNTFEIFRSSWFHLAARQDLYAVSPRYFDLFKYTPTFPILFAPFAILPFAVGLVLWNTLNAATLYIAVNRLLAPAKANVVLTIALADMIGSLQNAQSNALVAGLIILSYTELSRRRYFRAASAVCIGTFVKIFPLVGLSFALLRVKPTRFGVWCLVVGGVLFAAPILIAGPAWLFHQYADWLVVRRIDAADAHFSVMRLLQLWFGVDWPISPQQLLGVVALVAPLLWRRRHDVGEKWQLRYVASMLIFCVLFNHQAEPASFVIAMTGIGVWFSLEERRWWTWLVLALVVLGTMVVGSGALPATLRSRLFDLKIKTVPVLLVWIILQIQLWAGKRAAASVSVSSS